MPDAYTPTPGPLRCACVLWRFRFSSLLYIKIATQSRVNVTFPKYKEISLINFKKPLDNKEISLYNVANKEISLQKEMLNNEKTN